MAIHNIVLLLKWISLSKVKNFIHKIVKQRTMLRLFSKCNLLFFGIALLTLLVLSCKKQNLAINSNILHTVQPMSPEPVDSSLISLLAYKNSPHFLTIGYLTGDGADPNDATNPRFLHDSVDIACLFAGTYQRRQVDGWRDAQKRGIKLVVTLVPNAAFFDGSVNDPFTKLPGYKRPFGLDSINPNINSTYHHYAQAVYDEIIAQDSLDGIDIDVEPGFYGSECKTENAENHLLALAQFFGPKCTACKVGADGKKPLFVYDTDVDRQSGNLSPYRLYLPHKDNYDYIFFQSYTTGNRAWGGSGVNSLPALIDIFGPEKLLFLINGDTFQKHGDYTRDQAARNLLEYARFVKSGNGANGIGVGLYRMSRDYEHVPANPWKYTRDAISILNPRVNP